MVFVRHIVQGHNTRLLCKNRLKYCTNTIDESYAEINQGERYITIKNSIETLLEEIHTLTKLYIKALCQVGFLEAFNTATTELAAEKLKITNDCPQ